MAGIGTTVGLVARAGEAVVGKTPKVDKVQDKKIAHLEAQGGVTYRMAADANLFIAQAQGYSITYEPYINAMDTAISRVEKDGLDPIQPGFWQDVFTPVEAAATPTPTITPTPARNP